MKFIERCRLLSKRNSENNAIREYKRALKEIKLSSKSGNYSTKFTTWRHYENELQIYKYISKRLEDDGFKSEIEYYGGDISHVRLSISWN